jgi:hypothetical protein
MRFKDMAWTALALVFLAVSWAWEVVAPLVQAIIDLLPLRRLKAWAHAFLESLPPYPTLLMFIIPLALSEVIKIVAFVAFARGQIFAGSLIYLFAEVVRFGLAAYVWAVCREKLLSIDWVARLHAWLLTVHDWAQAQIAPVKAWIRQALEEAGLTGGKAGLWLRIRALWRHARRQR